MVAIALLDACAVVDVPGVRHSLHRRAARTTWSYLAGAGRIALAAAITPVSSDAPGLPAHAAQAPADVPLPGATVFPLLLCNDGAVRGPRCNGCVPNPGTGAIVRVRVMQSIGLAAATVFPDIGGRRSWRFWSAAADWA